MDERDIASAAAERSSLDERTAFLDDACAGDPELRLRVERLIANGLKSTIAGLESRDPVTRILGSDSGQSPHSNTDVDIMVSPDIGNFISPAAPDSHPQPSPPPNGFEGYDVLETIGRGGMGVVVKGLERALKRIVAIKTLAPEFAMHPQARARFSREAQTAAAVRHENIVTIYSVNESAGSPFLVMEFIPGKSLEQRIVDDGPLPIFDVVRIAAEMAAGLGAAHRVGLAHRDIKPANILLEEEIQRVKITDFGLARAIAGIDITRTGQVAGTPQYMSPEQAHGKSIDHRSDLFSLGSVMYTMCVGHPPFQGDSAIAVLRQVCDVQPRAIRTIRADVPTWLVEAIQKLMAKRPEDRFQSAADLERLLRSKLASGQFQIPTPVSESTLHPVPGENKPKLIPAILFLTVLALLSLVGWRLSGSRQPADLDDSIVPLVGSQAAHTPPTIDSLAQSVSVDSVHAVPVPAISPLVSPDYEWSSPVNLGATVNTADHEDHSCISTDGLSLIFVRESHRQRTLWRSRRRNLDEPFGSPEPLAESINANNTMPEAPWLTADGLTLWFVSYKGGGQGSKDIWYSTRPTVNDPFGDPINAGPPVNTRHNEASPFLFPDGRTLLFARGIPRQIMQSVRGGVKEPFGEPRVLANVNAGIWSEFPRVTRDGLAMIFAMSHALGQQDLFLTKRSGIEDEFDPPMSLGSRVNGGMMSGPSLTTDETMLFFSSDRPGGFGGFDLWSINRVLKSKPTDDPTGTTTQVHGKSDSFTPTPSERLASPQYEWLPLEDLGEPINTPGYEAGPVITADGLSLLFHGNEVRGDALTKLRIWRADRLRNADPFQAPELLNDGVNQQPESLSDPTITEDGLTIAFCMNRADGQGKCDLWLSQRPIGEPSWNPPINAGPGVNSEYDEWEPELSADGLTLLFHSDRPNENGGIDLWIAHREARNKLFNSAQNLGSAINTADHEGGAALSSDGLTLLFHRYTANALSDISHWQATRSSLDDQFTAPHPLLIPGLIERRGTGLSLSAAADRLYCTVPQPPGSPNIGFSRRVPKLPSNK